MYVGFSVCRHLLKFQEIIFLSYSRLSERETDRQIERQTNTQANRKTNGQTERETESRKIERNMKLFENFQEQ